MARDVGPKCRLCRREGQKLFLKGTRCETAKCAINRRENPPGVHTTWRRQKGSEYNRQLREKQKMKRYYGLLERQFKVVFHRAERIKGNTGTNLMILLERRLDNVVLRGNMAISRSQGRQMINHGLVRVNGRKIDIPSYVVNAGDVIEPVERENAKKMALENLEIMKSRTPPTWLEVSQDPPRVKVVQIPTRDEITVPFEEQLIVEILSR